MKREFKQHIKEDEFVGLLGRINAYLIQHSAETKILAGVVAVLLVGGLGLRGWIDSRERAAEADFTAGLVIFHAEVAGDGAAAGQDRSYSSDDEKYRAAMAAFDGFERRHPRSDRAPTARYYAALCRIEIGELDDAESLLNELATRTEGLEPGLALMALARVHRLRSDDQRAIDTYRRTLEKAAGSLPQDEVLMRLAQTLERAERLVEARQTYEELSKRFPTSVHAADARRRADFLEFVG